MKRIVRCDSPTAMDQADATVNIYFTRAIQHIDHAFGAGYAREQPRLVSAFIVACASDLNTSLITKALEDIGEAVAMCADALNGQRKRL